MQINPRFKTMIPPLTAEEREMLKESIKNEGVRDALIVWGDTLIDGHNRYEICQELGVPFETRPIDFADADEAETWILRNQLSRRNLSDVERARIALRLKDKIAAKAKERQKTSTGGANPQLRQIFVQAEKSHLPQNFGEGEKRHERETMRILAKEAGVSHETLRKVEKVDTTAPELVKEAMGSKIISIDKAYQINRELQKTPEERRAEMAQEILAESMKKKEAELARRQKIAEKIENMIYGVSCHLSLVTQENVDIMLEESAWSHNDWFENIDLAIGALNEIKGFIKNRNCIRRVK